MEAARATIDLSRITAHVVGGDDSGNAEPYLWTVFFKIDGDTAFVDSSLSLQGQSTVVATPLNQGNLLDDDVIHGEDVPIPAFVGEFRTILRPLPLQTPQGTTSDAPGVIGCAVVLLEEDNTPNSVTAAGKDALTGAVKRALDDLVPTLGIDNPEPTDEQIDEMRAQVTAAVEKAIRDEITALDFLTGGGDMDERIGNAFFYFLHDHLVEAGSVGLPISQRWDSEGSWELTGSAVATPLTWHGWQDRGGTLTSGPAVSTRAPHRLDCFVKATDDSLYHLWWNGSSWRGWEPLEVKLKGAPAAVSWGPKRIDVFMRGTEDQLLQRWWDGSLPWHTHDLGGTLTADPAVSSRGPGHLECFARATDGSLFHREWSDDTWTDWKGLGGEFVGAPAAVSWGPDRTDVFVRGTDDHMYQLWRDGSSWSDWRPFDGVIDSSPAVASCGEGRLDCFARRADGVLLRQRWTGVAWTGWEAMIGTFKDAPAAVSWGNERIDVFVRGMDDHMYQLWLD